MTDDVRSALAFWKDRIAELMEVEGIDFVTAVERLAPAAPNPAVAREQRTLLGCTPEYAMMLRQEIAKVRAWLTGFQAAGKAGPPGEDSLRQVQQLLERAYAQPLTGRMDSGLVE